MGPAFSKGEREKENEQSGFSESDGTGVSQDLQGRDESGQDVADQGSAFAGIDHLTKSASHA